MYYIVDTNKSIEAVTRDLETAAKNNGFGVLHIHNLGATLRSKGIAFDDECRVFEICNPGQAFKVLSVDMRLNMALPCRVSVFTDKGHVKIGYIKPEDMLRGLSDDPALTQIAAEVEQAMLKIVKEAR